MRVDGMCVDTVLLTTHSRASGMLQAGRQHGGTTKRLDILRDTNRLSYEWVCKELSTTSDPHQPPTHAIRTPDRPQFPHHTPPTFSPHHYTTMVSAKSLPDFSHHVSRLPPESVLFFTPSTARPLLTRDFDSLLDSAVYFITKLSLDTLLQQTTNHRDISGLSRFSPPETSTMPKVPPLNPCHFFSGALVSVNPLLVVATGGAVAALEQQWQNYYVLVDNTNVVPYGQLPTTYCSIVR